MENNYPVCTPFSSADDKTSFLQTLIDMLRAGMIVAPVDNGAVALAQVGALRPDLRSRIAELAEAIDLILNGGCFTFIISRMTREA
jgi:hypothetical protein